MQAYAMVETLQASLLEAILKIDFRRAHAIFFAAQNVRARNELLQTLLELEFGSDLKTYWASCSKFLLTLAQFRNAIAHWHPFTNIYIKNDSDETKLAPALGHPVLDRNFRSIEEPDFPPFIRDCLHIREELSSLIALVRERPSSLPERFRQPIVHRNEAVLQPRRNPKAQQPQRPPSSPSVLQKGKKPSPKQRRQRALSEAMKRHQI
jgi:hypothetical protein